MLTQCVLSLHPSEQWKCSRPRGANDVSQYGGMANRRVALAEAMGDINNNLNAGYSDDCGVLSSSVAHDGQVERFVVVSACGEHQAIAQSRCLGLTGTDVLVITWPRGHWLIYHTRARSARVR